jgi:hypothetical protein
MTIPIKSPAIREYFKFKTSITTSSFVDALKDVPGIEFVPHDGQRLLLDAYDERVEPSEESKALGLTFEYKYQILTAACGRRFGKSAAVAVIGAGELIIPNAKVLIVSYTLDNCNVIFSSIHKILKSLGIKLTQEKIQDMELTLSNGSTLRVASNDNVASRLGTAVSVLVIDEAKLFARELYEQILKPMTFDYYPLSRTILISSPQNGWLETYYERGLSKDPRWSKYYGISLPTHANPTIPREALEEMQRTMPPDLYSQEVLAQFTSSEGRVVREFDKNTCVYSPDEFPFYGNWIDYSTIFQSIDGGYSHCFASVWIAHSEVADTFFVLKDYSQNKTLTATHAENIKAYEEEAGLDVQLRYSDPANAQTNADMSLFDLYYNKAAKNTTESVVNLNTLFFQISEVTGRPKLLIHEDCVELIRQLQFVQWKISRDDKQTKEKSAGIKPFLPDKDGGTDWDEFDCLRYGLYSFSKNNMINASVFSFGGDDTSEEDEFTNSMNRAGLFKM